MTSDLGSAAGLIHFAFDQHPSQFWILGSSTDCASCINAVFTVKIDQLSTGGSASPRIAIQNTITLPTQMSWTHRILFYQGGLYVTELKTSTLAHVTRAVVDGVNLSETWDEYADWSMGLKAQGIDYNNTVY